MLDALQDLNLAIYNEKDALIGAEPLLAQLVRNGSPKVRARALEAWAHLLDGKARPENLRCCKRSPLVISTRA